MTWWRLNAPPGGLLRITIDLPLGRRRKTVSRPSEQFINVEDCEKVNRQLQFALEVDGIEYKRLEISSPGIDRPLRHLHRITSVLSVM
jgi:ribosome maturation factor RimP